MLQMRYFSVVNMSFNGIREIRNLVIFFKFTVPICEYHCESKNAL